MRCAAFTLAAAVSMLTWATAALAQDVAASPKSKSKDSVRIYRRYEKSKNQTITETGFMPIFKFWDGLDMNVSYTSPGVSPAAPQAVVIVFNSADPEHEHRRDLVVRADGEVYRLGAMDYRRAPKEFGNDGFIGKMTLSVPVDTFNRIAGAREVSVTLGAADFRLEERHLKKLRGLASAMSR